MRDMTIGIVGSLHGNETMGKRAIEALQGHAELVNCRFLVGNPAAIEKGVRFIDTDLNRSFPGSTGAEGRRAKEILEELRECDAVIDIHSTTAITPPFVVAVRDDHQTRALIEAVPVHRIVYMRAGIDPSGALIAHKPGISLEYPETTSVTEVVEQVLGLLRNLRSNRRVAHEAYESIGVRKGSMRYRNFEPAKGFVPILSGEKAYSGIACIMCRKVDH